MFKPQSKKKKSGLGKLIIMVPVLFSYIQMSIVMLNVAKHLYVRQLFRFFFSVIMTKLLWRNSTYDKYGEFRSFTSFNLAKSA